MPPKPRFTPAMIVSAAFEIVRREGWKGLSARTIAKELGASTRPIYDHLTSMQNLEERVVEKALDLFASRLQVRHTGDPWIDGGVNYVLFAVEERQLFRCINDEKHVQLQRKLSRTIWGQIGSGLTDYPPFQGLTPQQVERIRIARWFTIHGLATLGNSGWYPLEENRLLLRDGEKKIDLSQLVGLLSKALYDGLKKAPFPPKASTE